MHQPAHARVRDAGGTERRHQVPAERSPGAVPVSDGDVAGAPERMQEPTPDGQRAEQ